MKRHAFGKCRTRAFWLIAFLLFTVQAFAQQRTIRGKVVDEHNEAIIGANIMEKGTTNGVISDVNGVFSINVTSNATLVVSYIGYTQQEISVKGKRELTIRLVEDAQALSEVVVVGYGTARKRDLTGAVMQVKSSQLENESPSSMQDLLRANVPGLSVGFSAGSKPGGSLLIRGKNSINAGTSPLIVLDGVIYPGDLADISPNDIEQIDVLKDASSAAIYGARSASGVIIITTKMGKSEKPTINFDASVGIATHAIKQDVYGAENFTSWRTDVFNSANPTHQPYQFNDPRTLPSDISLENWMAYDNSQGDPVETWLRRIGFKDIEIQNYLAGRSVDWADMVFQNGLRQDYNASISGKTKSMNYYWSMGWTDNEGLITNDEFKSFRTRLNLDAKITDFLTVGMNTQFAQRNGSDIAADWIQYQKLTPYGTPTNEDGTMKLNPGDDTSAKHPLIDSYYTDKRNIVNNLNANIYAKVSLPFNISYQMNFSPRYEWATDFVHKSSEHPDWKNIGGSAYRNFRHDFYWQLDNIVKWKQTFADDHSLDFTFLFNAEKFQRWSDKMNNEGFDPNDQLGYHYMQGGILPTISSDDEYRTGDALMGRLFYSYKNRYMITGTVRRDGYSAFGQENPRAVFPSVALGWVFSDEPFMKKATWLDYGKLRLSWGMNGNRDIGVYRALARMGTNKYIYVRPDGTVYNGSYVYVNSLANKGLKWERTAAFNIGLDFSVLNDRLKGNIDIYKNNTKDLLIERTLPSLIGFDNVMSNLGEVENKGFELSLTSVNIKERNFTWNSTFNFTLNRNKILHLYGDMEDILDANGNVIGQKETDDIKNKWFIGKSIDEIWGLEVIGVWQQNEAEEAAKYGLQPGDFKLRDVDQSGDYTIEDNVFQGTTSPKFSWTLRNDFKIYKNLDVSFMLYSLWGHKGTFDIAKHSGTTVYNDRQNAYTLPYWTPENPTNKWARIDSSTGGNGFNVYRKKSFIRLDNISVGYTLPTKWIRKFSLSNVRVFANIKNVAVWAPDWDLWDPENSGPTPRTYTFGINVTM
nr:TonB-dependent receptor [uncultured Bacteroides sp.]